MIKIINQYNLVRHDKATIEDLNAAIADGFQLWATLPGWGFHEDFAADGTLILYKPDEPAAVPAAPLLATQPDAAYMLDNTDEGPANTAPITESLPAFQGMIKAGNYVVVDTETTGLHDGEICQIAIITPDGKPILDSFVKTTQPIPPAAQRIHGITDEMVKDAPTWAELQPHVRNLLNGRNVVIYNATYDRKMMHKSDERSGLPHTDYKTEATYWCAMELYADFWGDWNDYYGNYRWQKLTQAAEQQGIDVWNAHNALGDCLMTLAVIKKMAGVEHTAPTPTTNL